MGSVDAERFAGKGKDFTERSVKREEGWQAKGDEGRDETAGGRMGVADEWMEGRQISTS